MNKHLGIIILCALIGCAVEPENSIEFPGKDFTLFRNLNSEITFINDVIETPSRNVGMYDYFYNGGGVAIGDVNNDELPDIFFTGNDVSNRLYINQGNFKFKDNTEEAKLISKSWSTGALMLDINSDGWLDIYVCNSGPDWMKSNTSNYLYVNNRDGTFTERAEEYGIHGNELSTHAVFFDMDRDGLLDLFVLNHGVRNVGNSIQEWLNTTSQLPKDVYSRFCNKLYKNNGDGSFTDVSSISGIDKIGFGLGVACADFNHDGFPDIFVANDYFIPDYLYLNNGNGVFRESASSHFSHLSFFSMGCDVADINNDGFSDMVVLDMTPKDHYRNKMMMSSMNVRDFQFLKETMNYQPQYMFNSLHINNGGGIYSDIGHLSKTAKTDWSWAPLIADFDNDGQKDLFVTNGIYRDVKNNDWRQELLHLINESKIDSTSYFRHLQKAKLTPVSNASFKNLNGYEFKNANEVWGLEEPGFSNGAAYADLDNDGDLDLVINNLGSTASIYENRSRQIDQNNYIQFQFEDKNAAVNSTIEIWIYGKMQSQTLQPSRGYQSSVEPIVHFGIGRAEELEKVVFNWPTGEQSIIRSPDINSRHFIRNSINKTISEESRSELPKFMNVTNAAIQPPAFHEENEFDDFASEVLLPHRMSRLGPAMAIGDVNGDKLDDFYLGGAKNSSGKLYLQNAAGFFQLDKGADFTTNKSSEELGAFFVDINNDDHLDLYVSNGGEGDSMQDIIYTNDGDGNFKFHALLPEINISSKAIAAHDWDGDGDQDLFIGCRNVPGKYPFSEESVFLLNNGPNGFSRSFTDDDTNYGMVTDAKWVDLDGDDVKELMVIGEWMHPRIFKVSDEILEATPSDWTNLKGWWNCIQEADIDGDGDLDIALGNLGLNNKFHVSSEKPLYVFADDFDNNGTIDIVLSKEWKGELVPVRGKECSTEQMPFIQKQFKKYDDFARASLEEIVGIQELGAAFKLTANTFASFWLENKGNLSFDLHQLPIEAQIAPIYDFVIDDFNEDGLVDMLIAGNNSYSEVETTPYDAGLGLLLNGVDKGKLEPVGFNKSGVFLPGDVRALLPIDISADQIPGFIAAKNDSRVNIFMLTEN